MSWCMQCMQLLKILFFGLVFQIPHLRFWRIQGKNVPLQRNDRVYPTVTPAAMAEEHVCLCTDFLQQ